MLKRIKRGSKAPIIFTKVQQNWHLVGRLKCYWGVRKTKRKKENNLQSIN